MSFKLSAGGLPVLCEERHAAFLAEFTIGIKADGEDWEITSVRMDKQELPASSRMSGLIVEYIKEKKSGYVQDHIDEHLQDAREAAEYEAQSPHFSGSLIFREVVR